MEGSVVEPCVIFRCTAKPGPIKKTAIMSAVFRVKNSFLRRLTKGVTSRCLLLKDEMAAVDQIEASTKTREGASHLTQATEGINRIAPGMSNITENEKMAVEVVNMIDDAINFHQSDCIVRARSKLCDIVRFMKKVDAKDFRTPTKYFWEVVNRGKEVFFEGGVSCAVKHGTIILDLSSSGTQIYENLLTILGAFALETSEFQIAKETFSTLIDSLFDRLETATSRLRDLGAAYNNRGCISLITGDFNQAGNDFENSKRHFYCEKHGKLPGLSVNPMIIAVRSNISRLNLMSRNFAKGLEEQEKLVQECKAKIHELPLQTIFMVMHNQAVLHTTLGNLPKAEKELRWMIWYCRTMKREECDFLLNFVSLQLCEVLLLRGKAREAHVAFPFEALSVHDLIPTLGGLHFNVRMEAFEKMIDVLVKSGEMKDACELLHSGLRIVIDAFGPEHFNVASLLHKQGSILKLMGDVSSAMGKFERSAEILRKIFGDKHPLLIKCYMSLGDVAFQLGPTDKSYLYFQRAMENVEIIYQVSFPDQLATNYIKITRRSSHISCGIVQGSSRSKIQEHRIEGLVAEYGLALAVLLSRLNVKHASRRFRIRGKQPLQTNSGIVQNSESVLIVSKKCACDLLQSGQALLRQGMTKEAVAFFQHASKYCLSQGHSNASLVRLYTVFSHTSLMDQTKRDKGHVLKKYLEELTDVVTNSRIEDGFMRSSEDTEMLTFDSHLNLKLVLILLILLSIQLKMHDTTFAAYDLYVSLSLNDDKAIFSLNNGLQVYASRTSITCNGKTAVQDFLFSSSIGLIKSDSECHLTGKPLFRSLAYKNNVPTNSLLASYSASAFVDIGDVKRLEQKILSSFQEHFEINFLDTGRKATQVAVDLTPSSCFEQNILVTGSRIELLPLCFSGKEDTEEIHSEGSNISFIFPVLCEKTTCMTFADKLTSCFMFSRIGICLLQQGNSGKISVMRVQNQCLVLTVTDPLKAKITLWYEGRSIKQKVQLIDIAAENHQHSYIESEENPSYCRRAFDKFSPSAILQRAKTRELACETTEVQHQCSQSVEIPIVSDVSSEPNGIPLDDRQMEKPSSSIFSEETEEYEGLRKCFEFSTLECLTAISEISRQIYGNVVLENGDFAGEQSEAQTDHMSHVPDPNVAPDPNTTSSPSGQDTIFSPPNQEAISSDFQQASSSHEASTESQNLSLSTAPDSAATESQYLLLREGTTTNEANVDAKQLGRKLFEEDKKARSSFVATFSKDLKRKEESRKMNVLEDSECSSNESSEEPVVGEHTHNEAGHDESGKSDLKVCDAEKALDFEESNGGCSSSEDLKMSRSLENLETIDENERAAILPTVKEDASAKTDFKPIKELSQGATKDNHNEIVENFLTNKGAENAILKKASVVSQRECGAGFSDCNQIHHQKREDLQIGSRGKTQSEDLDRVHGEIDPDERREDYRYLWKEMNKKEKGETGIRNKSITTQTKRSRLTSQENGEAFFEGPWEQYLSDFNGDATDARLWDSQSGKSDAKQSGVFAGNSKRKDGSLILSSGKEVHSQDWIKTTCRQFLDDDVIADGHVTHNLTQTNQDVVDGPIITPKKPSNKAAMGLVGGEEATSGRSRSDFYRLSADEPIKNGKPLPLEACDVVDGPADPPRVDASIGYISPNFGGARPKEIFSKTLRNSGTSSKLMYPVNHLTENGSVGLDPGFVARHAVTWNSLNSSFGYLNCNGATWEDVSDDHYFSANYCNNNGSPKILGERSLQRSNMPKMGSKIGFPAREACQERNSLHSNVQPTASYQAPTIKQDESWHFPPLPNTTEKQVSPRLFTTYDNQRCAIQENSTQVLNPLFDLPGTQSPYNDMVSMTNEFYSRGGSYGDNTIHSPGNSQADSAAVSEGNQDSAEDATDSLLACLAKAMTRTVKLFASSDNVGKHVESKGKPVEKMSVQEQASADGQNEQTERVEELNSREHAAPLPQSDQTVDTVSEVPRTPVQESPRPVCSHYQRRCLVSFPCCGKFYPCHRCHNDSKACTYDQARAINATHIRCTICYHEQVIDEGSQKCRGCNSKMSAYFCAICKHFTSVDKNPFHCEKCGICRIHSDKSFHCDVCNVCLDKRLQGKHKCRPDSGHDECCICLEDAFSGCQILPCSHKVHKDCAIAMIQNGVRTCPICRHPLFKQPENATQ